MALVSHNNSKPSTSRAHIQYQKLYIPPLSGSSIPPSSSSPSSSDSSSSQDITTQIPKNAPEPESPQQTDFPNQRDYLISSSPSLALHHSQSFQYYQLLQMYNCSADLYEEWLSRQPNLGPIHRPFLIWAIGISDILAVVPLLALLAYSVFLKPISDDPEARIMDFVLGGFVITTQLIIGVGLVAGLQSSDDYSTLRYCNFWICCQCCYLLQSVIVLVAGTVILGSPLGKIMYIAECLRFVYRAICLMIVNIFKIKLEMSPKVIKDVWEKQQLVLQQQEENLSSDSFENQENIEMRLC